MGKKDTKPIAKNIDFGKNFGGAWLNLSRSTTNL